MPRNFIIHCKETTIHGNEYYYTFTGIAPNFTGADIVVPEANNFNFIVAKGTIQQGVDAPQNIGASFSPNVDLTMANYTAAEEFAFPAGTSPYLLFEDAMKFTSFLPNSKVITAPFSATYPAYQKGVYVIIEEVLEGAARTVSFRGFIDPPTMKWPESTELPSDAEYIDAKIPFTCHDRHATFLEATLIGELSENLNAPYFMVPDSEIPDTEYKAYRVRKNVIRENGSYPLTVITQNEFGGFQRGTYEAFSNLETIIVLISIYSGADYVFLPVATEIQLDRYKVSYDPRYNYSKQFEVALGVRYNPNGAGVTNPMTNNNLAKINVTKLFKLDDTASGGLDWSTILKDSSKGLSSMRSVKELLSGLCETFGLIAYWKEDSPGSNLMCVKAVPRDTLTVTIDLDAQTDMVSYSEAPFSDTVKDFVVHELEGVDTNYSSSLAPTAERDDVTMQMIFKKWDENDDGETAQENVLWYRNSQTIGAIRGINDDNGFVGILKIINTPAMDGIAYAVGIMTYADSNNSDPVLYKTEDNGVAWYRLTYTGSALLRDGVAIDDDTVVIVGDGGIIIKTIDGGREWEEKESEAKMNLFQCSIIFDTGSPIIYAIGRAVHPSVANPDPFNPGVIIKSTTEGETWYIIPNMTLTRRGLYTAMNVKYVSGEIVLTVGFYSLYISMQIWQTTDNNGEVFATLLQESPSTNDVDNNGHRTGRWINAFFSTGLGTMWACGEWSSGPFDGYRSLLWHTTNNWVSYSELSNNVTHEGSNFSRGNAHRGMYFTSDSQGFLVGTGATGAPRIWRSSDTGVTWFNKTPPEGSLLFGPINSITVIDSASETLIVGLQTHPASGLYEHTFFPKSTDLGNTWSHIFVIDWVDAATVCPLIFGVLSSDGLNVRYWTDAVPNVLTSVPVADFVTLVQPKISQGLTFALAFRDQMAESIKQKTIKFLGAVLTVAQRVTFPVLKFTFNGTDNRGSNYEFDEIENKSTFNLDELPS